MTQVSLAVSLNHSRQAEKSIKYATADPFYVFPKNPKLFHYTHLRRLGGEEV
jgi:hypothetical protein